MNTKLLWLLAITALVLAVGCPKNATPLFLGSIFGPVSLDENTSGEYSIIVSGDTGITYLWTCEPSSAGNFTNGTSSLATFHAGYVDQETLVSLRVLIMSDNAGPELQSMGVYIQDTGVTGLSVGSIAGPLSVDENTSADFSVVATGDTGITYDWSVDPATAGDFTNGTTTTASFNAASVSADIPVVISVAVNSDSYGPVTRDLSITVRDDGSGGLNVSNITGDDFLYELNSISFSVTASGDTGITYAWTCDPALAGDFTSPTSDSTSFMANDVDEATDVIIQVVVDSDTYFPVTRTHNIKVLDVTTGGWVRTWGGLTSETASQVACDSSGYAYVTGSFDGIADFDPTSAEENITSEGLTDVCLGKYDSYGNYLWTLTWGGTGEDVSLDIAVDSTGDIYVAGSFSDTVDFDPGTAEQTASSAGGRDLFISRFDSDGNFEWLYTFGMDSHDDYIGIALDPLDNLYITSGFKGTYDFDPGTGTTEATAIDEHDVFVVCFDSAGNFTWLTTGGYTADDIGRGVAVDGSGMVLFTGETDEKAFLIKYDPLSESFKYQHTWPSNPGTAIAIDTMDNVYIMGSFIFAVDFDPGPGIDEHYAYPMNSIFVNKFDDIGDQQWVSTWDGSAGYHAYYLGRDLVSSGAGVLVVQEWLNSYDLFWPQIYLEMLYSDGSPAWGYIGDSSAGESYTGGAAVDSSGNFYIAGSFENTVDFDPGSTTDEHTSAGDTDAYLMKLMPDGTW